MTYIDEVHALGMTVVLTITDEATERGLTSLRCMSPVVCRFSAAGIMVSQHRH